MKYFPKTGIRDWLLSSINHTRGVYSLYFLERCIYIGASNKMQDRLDSLVGALLGGKTNQEAKLWHWREKLPNFQFNPDLASFSVLPWNVSNPELEILEEFLIEQRNPVLNLRRQPLSEEGRSLIAKEKFDLAT